MRVDAGIVMFSITMLGCGSATSNTDGGSLSSDLAGDQGQHADSTLAACKEASAVTAGTMLSAQTLGDAPPVTSPPCESDGLGPQLYYTVALPAGQRLVAVATPNGPDLDLLLRLTTSCTASSCLSNVDDTAETGSEAVSYRDPGGKASSLILGVGSLQTQVTDTFDLAIAFVGEPVNTSCALATAVMNGTTLSLESGDDATAAPTASCEQGSDGAQLFYSVSVAAGATLTVQVTPIGVWDPVVRLLSTCSAMACLGSVDDAGPGGAEMLTYTNSAATATPAIIAVGAVGKTGPFSLQIGSM